MCVKVYENVIVIWSRKDIRMKIKINAKTLIQGIAAVVINGRLPRVVQKKPKIINSPSSSLMMVLQSLPDGRNVEKTINV